MSAQSPSQVLKQIESKSYDSVFLKTGFPILDSNLDGGFLKKELIVLGGQTGLGKSYVAGQIMLNIAKQKYRTAYFSLEISNEIIVSRLVGSIANIKPTRVLHGNLDLLEHEKRVKAQQNLTAWGDEYMYFYDYLYELNEIIKEIKENGFDFVVIDFVQNVFYRNSTDEYSRLSAVALELQKLAKEVNTCILLLSQLSNTVIRDGGKSSILEYKGSGNIATVCDLGFFIERSDQEEDKPIQEVKLNLRKNRRGRSGLYFALEFKHPGGEITEKPYA